MVASGAFFIGMSKGGLPGIGNLTVVLLALVFPAKTSLGILLPILISADVVAVTGYRRHTLWPYVLRLMPYAILGILIGWLVFYHIDDNQIRMLIGTLLLSMCGLHFFRQWNRCNYEKGGSALHHPIFGASAGIVAGFATMIANAAGPVAALYLMAIGLPKYAHIGTAAWFFFLLNLIKIPFMIQLEVLNRTSFQFSMSFMFYAVVGAMIAPFIVKHMKQSLFESLVWFFVVAGGLKLIF